MQLVRGGDEAYGTRGVREVGQVAFLALAPRWFRGLVSVRAAVHYLRDSVSEPGTDLLEPRLAALVFGGVVQEGGDHLVFRAAVLAHDGGHRQQVGDVGGACSFADLVPV